MPQAPAPTPELEARRRRGVRRTALAMGALAIAVYVAFLLAGALGR